MGFWAAVLATFVGGLLLLLVPWVRHRLADLGRWVAGQEAAAEEAKRIIASEDVEERRQRVLEVARVRGIRLAATAIGQNPTAVTWADGSRSWHYADFATYQRDMKSGRADRQRSGPGAFKDVPVSRWSDERIRQWLADNGDLIDSTGNGNSSDTRFDRGGRRFRVAADRSVIGLLIRACTNQPGT